VVVKELPRFNAVGRKPNAGKTGVYVLRALALRLGLDNFTLTIMPRWKFNFKTDPLPAYYLSQQMQLLMVISI
jgi:hypothetical protein